MTMHIWCHKSEPWVMLIGVGAFVAFMALIRAFVWFLDRDEERRRPWRRK